MDLSSQTIVITGLGGQGIVKFIQILGDALTSKNFTVISSETHGLSQRGGNVKCFIRYGNALTSPLPLNYSADIIITLEKSCILDVLEYARRDKATRLIITEYVKPLKNQNYPLQYEEPLVTGGLIDSFSLVHIAVFIENEIGVQIPDTDLTVETMDTIDDMTARIIAETQ